MATHQGGLLAVLNPPLCGKVSGLGTVVSMVEAGVVGIGEGHHKLTLLLGDLEINTSKKSINNNIQDKRDYGLDDPREVSW